MAGNAPKGTSPSSSPQKRPNEMGKHYKNQMLKEEFLRNEQKKETVGYIPDKPKDPTQPVITSKGGSKKTSKRMNDLAKSVRESSEFLEELNQEIRKTLEEKYKFDNYVSQLEAAGEAKWSEFLGDLPEEGSSKLTDKERERSRAYLERYANKMYDYYGNRANSQGKLGQDIRQTMTDGQVKAMILGAYGHSKEFGDELKKMVQDSRRFLWDRKVDLGMSKVNQNMDVVQSKYLAQMGAYQGLVGDYRKSMIKIGKDRVALSTYHKKSKGIRTGKGEGYRYASNEDFMEQYTDADWDAMTLDELEQITAGTWSSSLGKKGKKEAMKNLAYGHEHYRQDKDWDRSIEDYSALKWE